MQARSALFDLYGDHLRPRGGRAPVAALVRLLAPLGIAAPAVRTAVSRMVRQGWLHPLRLAAGPGYQLTPKAARRLDEAAARIYRTGRPAWDGRFDLLVLRPAGRAGTAQRLAANLAFLGYGTLDEHDLGRARARPTRSTRCSTRPGVRLRAVHRRATPPARRAPRAGPPGLGPRRDRRARTSGSSPSMRPRGGRGRPRAAPTRQAYAARFRLVHAWRTFLFRDPQLPPRCCPTRWPGTAAAAFFDRHAGPAAAGRRPVRRALPDASDRHVDDRTVST